MSLEDMTSDMILAEVQDALRRELEKKPLGHPVYHSGHIVSAIALGERIAEERIIKLLREKAIDLKRIAESIDEDEYANAGDGDSPYWGSFALDDFADALIKGEK